MHGDTREIPLSARPSSQPPAGGSPVGRVSAPHPRLRTGAQAVAIIIALCSMVGVWLTHRYFVGTRRGQELDNLAWEGAAYGKGQLWSIAEPVLDVVSVAFLVVGIGAAMLVAVLRRRWVLALQVAALVGGANLTTQLLKRQVFDRPDYLEGWRSAANSLPSGHTTAAASVSVALLLATPRSWRPAVAVFGAVYTGATGVSTLVGQWHRPSDVVAALLVVLAWGALVCAVTPASSLDRAPRRWTLPSGQPRPGAFSTPGSSAVAGLMLLGAAATAGAAVVAAGRMDDPATFGMGPDVMAYAAGALGVGAATLAVFALLLLVRQSTARPA